MATNGPTIQTQNQTQDSQPASQQPTGHEPPTSPNGQHPATSPTGQHPPTSPTVQHPPTSPTGQQPPTSPPGHQQTINIYNPTVAQTHPQEPPLVGHTKSAQDASERPPAPQPPPASFGPPPKPENKDLSTIYYVLRIIQTVICAISIVGGLIWFALMLFGQLSFTPEKPKDVENTVNQLALYLMGPFIVYGFIASIFGLIGSMGEVKCCQITYAIMFTCVFPYCILPWFIVVGMINDWSGKRRNAVHQF